MLIGRSTQLATLRTCIDQALAGRAAVAFVHGDPGVGKSALLAEVLTSASSDLTLLTSSGHPAECDLPYATLQHLLRPLASHIDQLPPVQRHALAQALALEVGAPMEQTAAASAVLALITTAAVERPVAICVDDLQWVDPSTRSVLVFLARRIDADAVVMLLGHRGRLDDDLLGLGTSVMLSPLSGDDAKTLLRHRHPDLGAAVTASVLERAGGLPLALLEIPSELSADQRRGTEPLPASLSVGVSLERLYEPRLRLLADDARLALLIASLDDMSVEDLTAALSHAGLSIESLGPAERQHLLHLREGRCQFAHPTVRGAVQSTATAHETARAHEVLAHHFADDPARFAHHAQHCGAYDDDEVADAMETAARRAEMQGGFAEATRAWQVAAERTTDPVVRRQRQAYAVGSALRSGAGRTAVVLLESLLESATTEGERAQWSSAWVVATTWVEGRPPAHCDALIALGLNLLDAGGPDSPAGLDLLMALASCQFTWGDYQFGRTIADHARERVSFDELPLGHQLTCDMLDIMTGVPGAGSFLSTPWIEDVKLPHLADPSVPIGMAGVLLGWLDQLEACDRIVRRCQEMTREHAGVAATELAIGSMAVIGVERSGSWDLAVQEYARAAQVCIDSDFPAPLPFISLRHAYLMAAQGHHDKCEELRTRALALSPHLSPSVEHLDACVRGLLHLSLGRPADAAQYLAVGAAIERRSGSVISGLTSRFVDHFEALWRLGRSVELGDDLAEFSTLSESMEHPGMLAAAARCAALEVDEQSIDAAFERVTSLERSAPTNVFESARTQLLWGTRLRRAKRKADARSHLLLAEQAFGRLSATAWLATTRSELAACGERRHTHPQVWGPLVALTPREFDVAKAAAAGASNSEAAESLFVSPRTVEYHLSNVFRKLGITSRRELATFFGEPS